MVLPEFDDPPAEPVALIGRWLAGAAEHEVREPLAVSLATADAEGRPSNRIVLLKGVVDGALIFTTHTGSHKGRDLAATPWAAVNFYWRETLQQITVDGPVEPLSQERSDALSPSGRYPPRPPRPYRSRARRWSTNRSCTGAPGS